MDKRYLTVQEAAAVARVHPETMREWCRTGKVPFARVNRRFLIDASFLDSIMTAAA